MKFLYILLVIENTTEMSHLKKKLSVTKVMGRRRYVSEIRETETGRMILVGGNKNW
jgi:hypothetical protein